MKILVTIAIVAGLASPAVAQDELTREQKDHALRMAYKLNGGIMNGPMIDLTDRRTIEAYERMLEAELPPVQPPPKPIKTVEVRPDPLPKPDICRRHGKRKVMTHGGRSWRCR